MRSCAHGWPRDERDYPPHAAPGDNPDHRRVRNTIILSRNCTRMPHVDGHKPNVYKTLTSEPAQKKTKKSSRLYLIGVLQEPRNTHSPPRGKNKNLYVCVCVSMSSSTSFCRSATPFSSPPFSFVCRGRPLWTKSHHKQCHVQLALPCQFSPRINP